MQKTCFTSGASFGNLSKVNVPAAGWWRLFLTGEFFGLKRLSHSESLMSELIFISQRANFSARLRTMPNSLIAWGGNTNNFGRDMLTRHHLASGVFSPRIRCPVRA